MDRSISIDFSQWATDTGRVSRSLWEHRDFMKLWTGQTGSRLGSQVSMLALPRIAINGGRRGYLVGIAPQVCVDLLGAKPVHCALQE